MAAFLLVDTKIHDLDGYARYKCLARPIAEKFGGEYVVSGGDIRVHDDELWSPTRLVLIQFPDAIAANAFLDSDEYAPIKVMRHAFANSTAVVIEGIPA